MKIITTIVGPLNTNCYILIRNNKCLIIDPGDEYEKIMANVGEREIWGILITHYHFDHTGALSDFINNHKPNIYDYHNHEEKMILGPFTIDVIKTPGHKEDAVTYYFKNEKAMFCGDFIFKNSIGRTDLNGGSDIEMKKSIGLIKKYDDDIIIYPGHGEKTTLGDEKRNNLYFQI